MSRGFVLALLLTAIAVAWYATTRFTKPESAAVQTRAASRISSESALQDLPRIHIAAAPAAPSSNAYDTWGRAVVQELKRRGDAESLATAALLDRREALTLLERAVELAPSDPAIRWLALAYCMDDRDCESAKHAAALRELDPQNGLAWLGELSRALRNEDYSRRDAAVAALAASKYFNTYKVATDVMIDRSIRDVRLPAPRLEGQRWSPADLLAIGAMATTPLPSMKPILDFCRNAASVGGKASCRQIAVAMRSSDTIFVNMIGSSVHGRWAATDSPAGREYAEARRRFDWLSHNLWAVQPSLGEMLRLLQETGSEMEMSRAVLREHGISVEPPPDWTR